MAAAPGFRSRSDTAYKSLTDLDELGTGRVIEGQKRLATRATVQRRPILFGRGRSDWAGGLHAVLGQRRHASRD